MKFAHIADVHLGTRRETPYLYDGFLNFIDYMELHPVDMIFITGDLFDHVPTKEDIMFVDTQLARLPKTDILYVTGECDYLARDSVLWNYEFVSRTYLLNCEDIHNHVPDGERAERNSYAEGIADSLHFAMSMSTESASIARRMNEMISTVYMPEISGQSISFLDMEEVQGFVRLMWKILEERILGISGLDISISIWHLRSSMYIIREVWSRSMRTKLENMGLSMDISTSS